MGIFSMLRSFEVEDILRDFSPFNSHGSKIASKYIFKCTFSSTSPKAWHFPSKEVWLQAEKEAYG